MSSAFNPAPITDSLSDEWFAAAREGKLLIQRRDHDGGFQWYPRAHALGTLDEAVHWVQASGLGRVYTFSEIHWTPNEEFAADTPYVLAIVELEEGPRLTTRIVNMPAEEIACDMPVRVVFEQVGEFELPYFERDERTS